MTKKKCVQRLMFRLMRQLVGPKGKEDPCLFFKPGGLGA